MKTSNLVLKSFIVGLFLCLPLLVLLFLPRCEESFLLGGCEWASAAIIWNLQIIFYLVSIVLFFLIFKRPKIYRAIFTVICANLSLFVIYLFNPEVLFSENMAALGVFIIFAVLFPCIHLFYYFLFNSLAPSLTKSRK